MSVDLFRRSADYARGVMSDMTSDDLRLATPCGDWDAGRVVLHLADVADALVGLLESGQLVLPEPARTDDPEPVCVAHAALTRLDARLSTASDAERLDAAARAGAIELTMHGWDIGVARDRAHTTPSSLAEEVWELAPTMVSGEVRDANFGPRVEVPIDAPPGDRLAAFLGRRPPARSAVA